MLTALLGNVETLHATSLRQMILDKTEGNPFFMEEIVQALAEQGTAHDGERRDIVASLPAELQLPPTVQAVLASRIDRLPPEEKAFLQTLAVIGKEFSLGLVKQVVNQSEDTLQQHLSRLRDAEFIYEQPAFPDVEYVFKHALTQEVAYNSLLQERRKVLHERAATGDRRQYRSQSVRGSIQRIRIITTAVAGTRRRQWITFSLLGNKLCSGRPTRKQSVT